MSLESPNTVKEYAAFRASSLKHYEQGLAYANRLVASGTPATRYTRDEATDDGLSFQVNQLQAGYLDGLKSHNITPIKPPRRKHTPYIIH